MDIMHFESHGKKLALYPSKKPSSPLLLLPSYLNDGKSVYETAKKLTDKDFSLLVIYGLDWDKDMSPWYCPPLSKEDHACLGGADEFLTLVEDAFLPEAERELPRAEREHYIAGYSLAGLFSLYALYKTKIFSRAASMSGSLWFPDFSHYVLTHEMKCRPESIYLSLGDQEKKSRNALLSTVEEKTEAVYRFYKEKGIHTFYELNPGNHFRDGALRSAKGIAWLLEEGADA